jgi:hypothetical protein
MSWSFCEKLSHLPVTPCRNFEISLRGGTQTFLFSPRKDVLKFLREVERLTCNTSQRLQDVLARSKDINNNTAGFLIWGARGELGLTSHQKTSSNHSFVIVRPLFVLVRHLFVLVRHLFVTCSSLVRHLFVLVGHLFVLVGHLLVTCSCLFVTCSCLLVTCSSLVRHLFVLVGHLLVTCSCLFVTCSSVVPQFVTCSLVMLCLSLHSLFVTSNQLAQSR